MCFFVDIWLAPKKVTSIAVPVRITSNSSKHILDIRYENVCEGEHFLFPLLSSIEPGRIQRRGLITEKSVFRLSRGNENFVTGKLGDAISRKPGNLTAFVVIRTAAA